jgi:hypothetical protein
MEIRTLFTGDQVRYNNHKQFDDNGKVYDLFGKIGEVIGHVQNSSSIIVDFNGDAYRVHPDNVVKHSYHSGDDHRMRQIERKWKTHDEGGKKQKRDQGT